MLENVLNYDSVYIKNLNKNLKKQKLIETFRFNGTAYLLENCHLERPGRNIGNHGNHPKSS